MRIIRKEDDDSQDASTEAEILAKAEKISDKLLRMKMCDVLEPPSTARSTIAEAGSPPRKIAQRLGVAYGEVAAGCYGKAAAAWLQQRLQDQDPPSVLELGACETFHEYDANGDGELSLPELGRLMHDQGAAMNYQSALRAVEEATKTGDRAISLQGFVEMIKSHHAKSHGFSGPEIEQLRDLFHKYDRNSSGKLEAPEYSRFFNDVGRTPRTKHQSRRLGALVATCRASGTIGPICFDEFVKLARLLDDETLGADRDCFFAHGS